MILAGMLAEGLSRSVGGILIARGAGAFISKVNKRIFPFRGTSEEERMICQYQMTEQQAEARRKFESQINALGCEHRREMTIMTAYLSRQTALQSNILSFSNSLKSKMFEEALRNYPLNIPPLVLLQNAGVSTNSVTGELVVDDPIAREILSITDSGNGSNESLLSKYKNVFQHNPVALNVFITPLLMTSCMSSREKITTLVWENIYHSLESLFVNEYNRCSDHPVNFYPAAWNQNAKPGLHAAEILYFFTKGMPVVVLEPRYDGKQLRFLFSCWGIGSDSGKQIRQEIVFDMNLENIILSAMYARSIESLKKINQLKRSSQVIADAKKKLEHNINMYEMLRNVDGLVDNPITEDITRIFFLHSSDYGYLSKLMADALGICISLMADVHHLTSRGKDPHFPELLDSVFHDSFQLLTKPERHELMETINGLMKSAYFELLLSDSESENDFSSFKKTFEKRIKIADYQNGIIDNIEPAPQTYVTIQHPSAADVEVPYKVMTIPEIRQRITDRCVELGINSIKMDEKLNSLKTMDPEFVSEMENLCQQQLVSLSDVFGK